MVFKYYSFLPGDEEDLNNARPGSPPAFFSLPSPVSPRICGNCIPGFAAGAATAAAVSATRRSFVPVPPAREPLPRQQQVRNEAAAEVKDQKSASVETSSCHTKKIKVS
ncbi:hypothetical protein CRG98_011822 [Punica granatum]|uniref:Uncharacterized protein n=1 Tax=Punica granatum TaxID=22663 RepID=A0A2I0KGX8_PUNGR|nr:hypothetical protein CRG98_011822 [Punica granatum]